MVKKSGDWRKNMEANSRLMKKFEESRAELEKVLQIANSCLKEKGNPEELLRKHTVSRASAVLFCQNVTFNHVTTKSA